MTTCISGLNEPAIREELAYACEEFGRANPLYTRAMANTIKHVIMGDSFEYTAGLIKRDRTAEGGIKEVHGFTVRFYHIANHYELVVTLTGQYVFNVRDYGRS